MPSHSRKDEREQKIHQEAVLYRSVLYFSPKSLLSRVEEVSNLLRQSHLFEADLAHGRSVNELDIEKLTGALRGVAQVLLEMNLVRLKSFESPSRSQRRNAESRREMANCLTELCLLVEGLFSLPFATFDSNSEIIGLLLLLKASLCVLIEHEGST